MISGTWTRKTLSNRAFGVTVASIWDLPDTSSCGDGTLGAIERSITATQTVNEIQALSTDDRA